MMTDISVILTAHREAVLAGTTIRSALAAINHVRDTANLSVEVVIVLDRANDVTAGLLRHGFSDVAGVAVRVLETNEGDPGQARNCGIAVAQGTASTFLDADDLVSENWLSAAWAMHRARPDAVLHSACNLVFGMQKNLWWHIDSEGPLFDPGYLAWANYWDAMSFGATSLYRANPFRANDLTLGFGHEDWHWNCLTLARGYAHKPVPQTIHFKRRRGGSQMSLVDKVGGIVWPITPAEVQDMLGSKDVSAKAR